MLNRLRALVSGVGAPSVIAALGNPGSFVYYLHIVPEDGVAERFGLLRPAPSFRYNGAEERSREQLGTITLYKGDGESADEVLADVQSIALKALAGLRERGQDESGRGADVDACERCLGQAIREVIAKRADRPPSDKATQTLPICLVRVVRSRPGPIVAGVEPTSFPS